MKEMLINEGMRYDYQKADGTRKEISSKEAWKIFTRWQKAGKTIRRKYGFGGRVTWVWPEDETKGE